MKAHLLHPTEDFDWRWALKAADARAAARSGRTYRVADFDPESAFPWGADALAADLALDTLFAVMARGDDRIYEVSRRVIHAGVRGDLETIRYRQAVLRDCLAHPGVVRALYAVAVEAVENQKRHYLGSLVRYPDSVLRDSVELMGMFLGQLRKLRAIADAHAGAFAAAGWTAFFAMVKRDLDDDYFDRAKHHLAELRFRHGVLLSATLGQGNKGSGYVLRGFPRRNGTWRELWHDCLDALWRHLPHAEERCPAWLRPRASPVYSFSLHPRDDAGARALTELRNRGISLVADALGRSADHVRSFFGMLQAELAFYVGCINLHERLAAKGEPLCMPTATAPEPRRLAFRGLYNVCLALNLDRRVVGNNADADGKDLVVVTGANTGGKSTFLRSLGLAQLMMQSGMFVPADDFRASLVDGVFTHFKREEDAGMTSGKFDEELARMSAIVDHLKPRALTLFNESFAATNEREGSQIARQIITALLERRIRVVCVTHLYELARGFHESGAENVLYLRAERNADGVRTFRLVEGEPLATSFGEDLYETIFGVPPLAAANPKTPACAP
jgi:MutS domain V